jgi:probable blue pigment (indigoidine) exporter
MTAIPDLSTTAVTALVPSVWGTTYIVTTELLPPDRPLLAATLRALPVGLLMLAATRSLPHGSWWWRSGVLGVLNIGIFFGLLFLAAYRLPGGVAATLVATTPLLVVLVSWPLLGIRPRRLSLAAAGVGLAGVALLVLRPDARLDVVGIAAAVGAAFAFAFGIVLTKRWGRPGGLLAFTSWQLIAGGLVLLPFVPALEGLPSELDSDALWGFAYLGLIGTGLAYVVWFRGIARLEATRVSLLGLFSPLVAVIIGVAFAGERFGPAEAGGVVLVLLGVLIGQRPQRDAGAGTDLRGTPQPPGRELVREDATA